MTEHEITLEIDGRSITAPKGARLIDVAEEHGIYIPRFCYHKKLSAPANCRMCLVEVAKAPKPLPACTTGVQDGMQVFTRSPLALDAQKGTMEFLLINHPLDCPICDQGGECELQDLSMGYGSDVSRYTEGKRVVRDEDLGPLISTDMTRCIHCTRCVRFGEEIAGLRELGATGRGEDMRIGTFMESAVSSELSGNVIDLCPVGALTNKPYRYTARPWELVSRPGISPHDAVGSNIAYHVRRGQIMRAVPRENEAVNETWLADRDRYSCHALANERLTAPEVRNADGRWQRVDWEIAMRRAVAILQGQWRRGGGSDTDVLEHGQLGVLAGPASTLEELYLVQRLARELGTPHVDHRLSQSDQRVRDDDPVMPWLGQDLAEVEASSVVLIVGANLRKDQPLLNHRIRKAAQAGAAVFEINPVAFEQNFELSGQCVVAPRKLKQALAHLAGLLGDAGLSVADGVAEDARVVLGADPDPLPESASHVVRDLGEALREAAAAQRRVSVVLGDIAVTHGDFEALRRLSVGIAVAVSGQIGVVPSGGHHPAAALAGCLPHRGTGGKAVPTVGLSAAEMMAAPLARYVLLNVEPDRDVANAPAARQALAAAEGVVAMTAFDGPGLRASADVLLPVAAFAETAGTWVNAEGRWQTVEAVANAPDEVRPAWKVLRLLGSRLGLRGFDFVDWREVYRSIKAQCVDVELSGAALDLGRACLVAADAGASRGADELDVIAYRGPYAVDAVVRRATPLQETADAWSFAAHICAATAARLGLVDGTAIAITQPTGRCVLDCRIDDRVAPDAVLIPVGVPGSEHFDATAQTVSVGPAMAGETPVNARPEPRTDRVETA